MILKDYSELKGTHAFCGASKKAWRNYTPEKLVQSKINSYAADIGTALHEYAANNIKNHFKMAKGDKHSVLRYLVVDKKFPPYAVDVDRVFPTLMTYVNDAIGFKMDPEVVLFYSDNFYGTTDAFSWRDDVLRISDLKTGVMEASFTQLENYAAFFCLSRKIKPSQIKKLEFRIYQSSQILLAEPDPLILDPIINQIIEFNNILMDLEGRR